MPETTWENEIKQIRLPDEEVRKASLTRWNHLAKPLHGMGALETMLARIAGIQGRLHPALQKKGIVVLCADNGTQGLDLIRSQCPDIILLDLVLPDMSGNKVISEVRTWTSTPIIVISARTAEHEKVQALDLGADDYITKPFGTSELLARIRASLRHSNRLRTDSTFYIRPYRHGEMTLDFSRRLLKIGQDTVHLTPIEYKIVAFLAQNSGKVVTYSTILSNVWGPYADGDNKILRVNMANIRRKIETDPAQPKYIYTEVGVGYRMAEDEDDSQMM